jgi:hypothetical protein
MMTERMMSKSTTGMMVKVGAALLLCMLLAGTAAAMNTVDYEITKQKTQDVRTYYIYAKQDAAANTPSSTSALEPYCRKLQSQKDSKEVTSRKKMKNWVIVSGDRIFEGPDGYDEYRTWIDAENNKEMFAITDHNIVNSRYNSIRWIRKDAQDPYKQID